MLLPCLNCGQDIHYVDWSGFNWPLTLTPIQSGWFHTNIFEENCHIINQPRFHSTASNLLPKATPNPEDHRIIYECASCGKSIKWSESNGRWEHTKPRNPIHARNCDEYITSFATPKPVGV